MNGMYSEKEQRKFPVQIKKNVNQWTVTARMNQKKERKKIDE